MYIEFVILDNFVLTFLAGTVAARLCHSRVNVFRVIGAAAAGTVVAVFYPYLRCGFWLQFMLKIALWLVLSVVMYIKTPRFIISAPLLLGCTFALGGASYALGYLIFQSAEGANAFCEKFPLFLTLGCGALVYLFSRFIIKRLRLVRERAPYNYGAVVEVFGKKIKFEAFLDTGNCVFDERTGLPVIITDIKRFSDKLDGASAIEFMKNADRLPTTAVTTPAGKSEIFIVKPTAVTVYTDRQPHKIEAVVGLVRGNVFGSAHEMLLNPAVFAEGV